MRFMAFIISFLIFSSTLSAAYFMTVQGVLDEILTTTGATHSYAGANLGPDGELESVIITSANLSYADLFSVNLEKAQLQNTLFNYANLQYADLKRTDLSYCDFRFADLVGADLAYSDLRNTLFSTGHNFSGTDFAYADLGSADLRNADFSASYNLHLVSDYTNTMLYGATLPDGYDQTWFEARGADFTTVPEPSTYALLLGGLALGLVVLRRR